mgnify:FL=1
MKQKIVKFIFIGIWLFVYDFQMSGEEHIRGCWMYGSSLNSENISSIVNKLADNYINNVYLLVKGTGGTKTNPTILTNFITQAHSKAIKVHLWYCVFQDKVYVTSHPDAHVYHCPNPKISVKPYQMDTTWWVNPLYPGYKEYVLRNIGYFVNNFNCDGIHLDYIRYSHMVYSFDPFSLKKAASLGCDTTRLLNFFNTEKDYVYSAKEKGFVNLYLQQDKDVVAWVTMRKNVISNYISAIRDIIEKVKPTLELTAAFMPESAEDPNYGDVYYAQNYALHSTWLDMIAPMSYFKSYNKNTNWLKSITSNAITRVVPTCKIAAGLQAFDGVSTTEMKEQINYALEGGAHGVIIFQHENITDNCWNIINSHFKSMLQR